MAASSRFVSRPSSTSTRRSARPAPPRPTRTAGELATWALAAAIAIGGVGLGIDALVVDDEERVGELADLLGEGRPDALLAWVDTERAEVTVRDGRDAARFGPDDDAASAILAALASFDTSRPEVVQRSVSVQGDRAEVALRVRSDGDVDDVIIGLRRDGQSWLLTDVRRL